MNIVLGLLMVLFGLGLLFAGLRIFLYMLPIAGFVTGFFGGAMLIANWMGEGFLSTVVGWIAGIIVGIAFAIISYMYWYIGALFAAGGSGALIFSGFAAAFGVNAGWGLLIAALIGAFIFVAVAVMLNLPIYIVLVNTAILGGYTVIAGALLLFDRAGRADLGYGAANAAVNDSWLWWIALIVLAAVGIFSQVGSLRTVQLPVERWGRARQTAAIANDSAQR